MGDREGAEDLATVTRMLVEDGVGVEIAAKVASEAVVVNPEEGDREVDELRVFALHSFRPTRRPSSSFAWR